MNSNNSNNNDTTPFGCFVSLIIFGILIFLSFYLPYFLTTQIQTIYKKGLSASIFSLTFFSKIFYYPFKLLDLLWRFSSEQPIVGVIFVLLNLTGFFGLLFILLKMYYKKLPSSHKTTKRLKNNKPKFSNPNTSFNNQNNKTQPKYNERYEYNSNQSDAPEFVRIGGSVFEEEKDYLTTNSSFNNAYQKKASTNSKENNMLPSDKIKWLLAMMMSNGGEEASKKAAIIMYATDICFDIKKIDTFIKEMKKQDNPIEELARNSELPLNHDLMKNLIIVALANGKITQEELIIIKFVANKMNMPEDELKTMFEEERSKYLDHQKI